MAFKKYVIAFSGGADSALLAFMLKNTSIEVRAIHINHGESAASCDSAEIERFCVEWCDKYQIPLKCISIKIDEDVKREKGTEAAERKARYDALINDLNDDEILVTGHHNDDSIETILFRLARGSSASGLTGIKRESTIGRRQVHRPLIDMSKKEILDALSKHGVDYWEDRSNQNLSLSRNFIRNTIIPNFISHFGEEKFKASINRFAENMDESAKIHYDLFKIDADTARYFSDKTFWIYRILDLPEYRQSNLIYQLLKQKTGQSPSKSKIQEILKRLNGFKDFSFHFNGVVIESDKSKGFLKFSK